MLASNVYINQKGTGWESESATRLLLSLMSGAGTGANSLPEQE
jgi:hypothetical protein